MTEYIILVVRHDKLMMTVRPTNGSLFVISAPRNSSLSMRPSMRSLCSIAFFLCIFYLFLSQWGFERPSRVGSHVAGWQFCPKDCSDNHRSAISEGRQQGQEASSICLIYVKPYSVNNTVVLGFSLIIYSITISVVIVWSIFTP